ncbi:O-fucosyltransferase 28 [Bienertia sinuspersici]
MMIKKRGVGSTGVSLGTRSHRRVCDSLRVEFDSRSNLSRCANSYMADFCRAILQRKVGDTDIEDRGLYWSKEVE